MKKCLLGVAMVGFFAGCCSVCAEPKTDEGWVNLFNGKDFTNFRAYKYDAAPTNGWSVQDGVIAFAGNKCKAGDLRTSLPYSNFELMFDFKISPKGNSGVKYLIWDVKKGYPVGCEYQVLDDFTHPDAKHGHDGNRKTASLYDVIAAPADKPLNPIGQWNTGKIVVNGPIVQHWLNGVKVVEFNRESPEFDAMVAKSKFAKEKMFAKAKEGYITFQDHDDPVWYRNIKIRPLR